MSITATYAKASAIAGFALVLVTAATGCTVAPLDGDALSLSQASGAQALSVSTFLPNAPGTIIIKQNNGHGGPAISSFFQAQTLAATDVQNVNWYSVGSSHSASVLLNPNQAYWSESYGVPAGSQNYLATVLHITGTSSALGTNFTLYSFSGGSNDAATNACLQNNYVNSGGLNTISACGGKQSDIVLKIPCGGPGQACCIPTCAGGPLFGVSPCNNGSDGTMYTCSTSPYTVGGVCTSTGNKCDGVGLPPCPPPNCPGATTNPVAACAWPRVTC